MVMILFVCYGNICRSPMAEYLMRDLVEERGEGKDFYIASAATSGEEVGRPVHRGTANILERMGIDCSDKRSVKLKKSDYAEYDHIIGMDEMNRRDMLKIFGGDPHRKIKLLMEYAGEKRDIADPWWTGDFAATFADVTRGIRALYNGLRAKDGEQKQP